MTLREELEDRADKLDAELLDLSGRIKEIERQSNELHTCLNALDIAEMDAEDAALEPTPIVNTDEGWELEPALIDEPDDASEFAESGLPEGFTAWAGGDCPVDPDAFVSVMFRDGETSHDYVIAGNMNWAHDESCASRIYAYKITEQASAQDETLDQGASEPVVQTLPGEAEESRDQFEEEAQLAAAIELTADVEPEIQALIESGEHSYDEVAAIAYPEPQWNEPQPTEGYAPVVDNVEAHIQAVEAERYAQPTNPEADALAKAHDWYDPKAVAERNRFNPWGGVAHLFGKPKVDA
jgi:hypothetical protein